MKRFALDAEQADAIARARAQLPPAELPLSQRDAQLVVAREYGFLGWKDLLKEVESKNFRLDLYHRLSVILIHVPSLNERRDDIPLLVDQFLTDICSEYGTAKKEIDEDAIQLLQQYNWTGNIRELRNVVERLVILSGKKITTEDVSNYVMPK